MSVLIPKNTAAVTFSASTDYKNYLNHTPGDTHALSEHTPPKQEAAALLERPVVPIIKSMCSDDREQSRIRINILSDTIATVVPFLVEEIHKDLENGASISWMTFKKTNVTAFLERDLLSQYGVC